MSLLILTSPSIIAVDFRFNISLASIFPLNFPSMSAFKHLMFPSITPSLPTTTLPEVVIEPFKNPSILILDEATSALDTESEKKVQKAIESLMKDRTALVIAHRLSTVQNADKIIVIEKGKVIENGSHIELYEKNGLYRRLYDIQFD